MLTQKDILKKTKEKLIYSSPRKTFFHFGSLQGINLALILFFKPEVTNFPIARGNFLNAGSS